MARWAKGSPGGGALTRRAWLRAAIGALGTGLASGRFAGAQERGRTFVVMVDGSREYHTPGCALVRGNATSKLLSFGDAEAKGITPHAECHASASGKANAPPSSAVGASAAYWLDVKTRRYHRAGCSLIGLPRVQISLARAGEQKYLPCRSCRPDTVPPAPAAKKPTPKTSAPKAPTP